MENESTRSDGSTTNSPSSGRRHDGSRQYDDGDPEQRKAYEEGRRLGYQEALRAMAGNTQYDRVGTSTNGGSYGGSRYGGGYSQADEEYDRQWRRPRTDSGRFRDEIHYSDNQQHGNGGEWRYGYDDVPYHPGLRLLGRYPFSPRSPYYYRQPHINMQHGGPGQNPMMAMSRDEMRLNMSPYDFECIENLMRRVIHEREHHDMKFGNQPGQVHRIVFDLNEKE